jgi:ABC-type sugar transport system permease subunit
MALAGARARPVGGRGRAGWSARRAQAQAAYLFLLVPLALFVAFRFAPLLHALCLSFTDYSVLGQTRWVGWANYAEALRDEAFRRAVAVTVAYAAAVVLGVMASGLALAVLLNGVVRGLSWFRAAFYLPVVTSMVVAALLWSWVYDPATGLANALLTQVGLPPQNWLQDARLALPALVLMRVWKGAGYHMVIYLAALQTVPRELYEAASLDGAGPWARFRHVTLPMLRFALLFDFVIATSGALQSFEEVQVMTRGGPAGATTTVVYLVYQNAFDFLRMGYASAQAFLLMVLIVGLTATGVRWFRLQGGVP